MRRMIQGVLALILATVAGVALSGADAMAATTRPGAPCAAFPHNVDPNRIYLLHKQTCDITGMAVAVHDGNFRSLYGPEIDYAPVDTPQILAILDGVDETIRRAALAQAPAADGRVKLKVMIFAHGGLVGQDDAIAEGQAIAPGALADGFVPIFLIWNSDFPGAYGERLCCVLEGEQSKRGLPYFVPVRFLGDLAAGVSRAPEYYGQQLIRFNDSVLRRKDTRYFLSRNDQGELCRFLGPSTCDHIGYPPFHGDDRLNGLDQPIEENSGLYRMLVPVRMGTTAILSQIGAESWDDMVRRTRLALQPPVVGFAAPPAGLALAPEDPCDAQTRARLGGVDRLNVMGAANADQPGRSRFDAGSEGAFAIFADHLACEIKHDFHRGADQPRLDVELHFYGHSMGAIVGDQLIGAYPELPWKRIVYMAAADSVRDFRSDIATLMTCAPGERPERCLPDDLLFHGLMLHPLAESHDLEFKGLLPEGSLLEWIDEMFGGPRSIDDRTFGKWTNVEMGMAFLPARARERMYFRVFPAQPNLRDGDAEEVKAYDAECTLAPDTPKASRPPRCHPIRHGEFTQYSFWRDSFLCDPAATVKSCRP